MKPGSKFFSGLPTGKGFTGQIFDKLLEGIEVRLETDFFKSKLPKHKKVIYTASKLGNSEDELNQTVATRTKKTSFDPRGDS